MVVIQLLVLCLTALLADSRHLRREVHSEYRINNPMLPIPIDYYRPPFIHPPGVPMTADDFEPDAWPYDNFQFPFPVNRNPQEYPDSEKPSINSQEGNDNDEEQKPKLSESEAGENPGKDKEEGLEKKEDSNPEVKPSENNEDASISKNTDYALYPVGTAVPAGSNQPGVAPMTTNVNTQPITSNGIGTPVVAQPNPGQVQYVYPQNYQPNVVPVSNPGQQFTFVNVPNNAYNPQPNNNVYYVANQPGYGGYQVANQPANGGYQIANQPANGGYQIANQPANGGYQIANQPTNGGYQVNPAPTYILPNNQPAHLVPINTNQPQYVFLNNPGNVPSQPTYVALNQPSNGIPSGNQYVTLQPNNGGPYLISLKDKDGKNTREQ